MSSNAVKFSVDSKPLRSLVAFVRPALGGSSKELAKQVVRFDVEKSGLLGLTSSDGEITLWGCETCSATEGGRFAMVGARLVALCNQLKDHDVFHFTVDEENVEIQAGGSVVNFERYDPDLLEHTQAAQTEVSTMTPSPAEAEIARDLLAEALAICSETSDKATGKVELGHIELRNQTFLSSDGRLMCAVSSEEFHPSTRLKIPGSVVGAARSATRALTKDAGVTAYEGEGFFFLTSNNRNMAFRKAAAEFPAVETSIFGDFPDAVVTVNRDAFQKALQDVALGLSSDQQLIGVKIEKSTMELTSENSVQRTSRVSVPVEPADLPVQKFGMSITHFSRVLKVMKETSLTLQPVPAHNLVRMKEKAEEHSVTALLPFRTAQAPAQEHESGVKL